jgi:hypothetical protein
MGTLARVKSSDIQHIRVARRDAYRGSRVLKVDILAVHLRSNHASRDAREDGLCTRLSARACAVRDGLAAKTRSPD